jgi:uracil DNA glycosylase
MSRKKKTDTHDLTLSQLLKEKSDAYIAFQKLPEYKKKRIDVKLSGIKVLVIAKSPYSQAELSTGLAYEVPEKTAKLPHALETLKDIMNGENIKFRHYDFSEMWPDVLFLNAIQKTTTYKKHDPDNWCEERETVSPSDVALTRFVAQTVVKQNGFVICFGREAKNIVAPMIDTENKICRLGQYLCLPNPNRSINTNKIYMFDTLYGTPIFNTANNYCRFRFNLDRDVFPKAANLSGKKNV